jgi:hypothetical protein
MTAAASPADHCHIPDKTRAEPCPRATVCNTHLARSPKAKTKRAFCGGAYATKRTEARTAKRTCSAHMSPLEGQANESASCDRAPERPKPITRTSHTSSARVHEALENRRRSRSPTRNSPLPNVAPPRQRSCVMLVLPTEVGRAAVRQSPQQATRFVAPTLVSLPEQCRNTTQP